MGNKQKKNYVDAFFSLKTMKENILKKNYLKTTLGVGKTNKIYS